MTKMLTAALLAAAAFVPAVAQAQALPAAVVAVVDRERVLNECTACKSASAQIETMIKAAQARQQTLSTPLQTQDQALQAEANRVRALPEGAPKTAAIAALQQRAQAFQVQQQSAQQELARLQQNIQSVNANVLRQINEKLNPVIQQVMTQRGANVAVDQDATLAAARSIDVTDGVLAALNTSLTSVSVTPMPASATPAATTPRPTPPTGR